MKKKIKVAYLLDKSNNWLEKYLKISDLLTKSKIYRSKIFKDYRTLYGYDIVFILGYSKILKDSFLNKNKLNLVVHESELPQGKGFAPVSWQILENKNKISVCLFKATDKVDSGSIYFKGKINFNGTELYDEIRFKQAKATIKIVNKFLKKYPKISAKAQKGKSSYYRKRKIDDNEININSTIKKSFNKLRIGNNKKWPSYFYLKKKKYIIKIFKSNEK